MERPGRESEGELVLLTVCGSTMEASLLRAALQAHDVFCFVQGENHRQLLGDFAAFIELRVMVPRRQLEEARTLLADLRANPPAAADDDEDDPVVSAERPVPPPRSVGGVLVRAVLPGFGAAHRYVGAHGRGFAMFAAEVTGLVLVVANGRVVVGAILAAVAVGADALGATAILHRGKRAPLPRAIVR